MSHLLTCSDAIATHARLNPDKVGTRDSHRSLTYREWDRRASQLGAGLLERGLQPQDRVAILAYNRIEWMEIYVALARVDLVAVPINFRLSTREIAYIATDCSISAIIAGPEFADSVDSLRTEWALAEDCYILIDAAEREHWTDYEALIASAPLRELPRVDPDRLCALMYTSGTTGRPKGAMRRHSANTLIAFATALDMGFTHADTGLLVMPLCHANSLYFASTFMHLGATVVIDDRRSYDPEALLETLVRDRVTFTSLVPTHFVLLLALPDEVKRRYDVSGVGKLMISSAPARKELKRAILDYFTQVELYELYGSTEAGWVTLLRPDEQISRLGSVGREWALSGAIRLLDEQGNEVADGEVGELFSRTSYVFDGYWNNAEKTAEAFNGAWCSVGDMARRDEDGYLWLVDRKSNMIISGGENIYPSEVEAVLAAHEAVRDVAAIGVPDERWGETVHAVVVLHEGQSVSATALSEWCQSRLARFKQPKAYHFLPDDQIPRTATGKIQHRLLREKLSA